MEPDLLFNLHIKRLTGLDNRRLLKQEMYTFISTCCTGGHPSSVACCHPIFEDSVVIKCGI
jgi:GGDEF domain-containing protein